MSKEAMKLALGALESKDTWGSSIRDAKERAITALREALAEQPAQQEQDRQIDQLIKERDHRDEIIDKLCDAVLGPDRYEWSSQYFFEDAVREVEERMAEQPAQQEPTKAAELVDALIAKYSDKLFDSVGPHDAAKFEEDCNHIKQTLAEQPAQRKQVGDSRFESWYSEDFDPKGKGTKQQMREAYEAGMNDPSPPAQPQQETVAIIRKALEQGAMLAVHHRYSNPAAYPDQLDRLALQLAAAPQPAQQEPVYVYTCKGCKALFWENDLSCDCTVNGLFEFDRHVLSEDTSPPAQQQQKPVTDKENEKFRRDVSNFAGADPEATKYALEEFLKNRTSPPAQRTWVGLTEKEMNDITCGMVKSWVMDELARTIEAKLKEKNT